METLPGGAFLQHHDHGDRDDYYHNDDDCDDHDHYHDDRDCILECFAILLMNDDEEGDDDEREKHQRNSQNNSIASVHRTGLRGKPDDDPAAVDYDHDN